MKNIKIGVISILLLSSFVKIKTFQSEKELLKQNLIGTWISNDEPTLKINFDNSDSEKIFEDGNLRSTYKFTINELSCGENTRTDGGFFLKTSEINDPNDFSCEFINGIHKDSNNVTTLSLTNEMGQLDLYTKQN